MRTIDHLHLKGGQNFTETGIRSLFDPNNGMRQLKHLRIFYCRLSMIAALVASPNGSTFTFP